MEENYKKTTEKEILAVSFGTSYNDSREKTIGAIELEPVSYTHLLFFSLFLIQEQI